MIAIIYAQEHQMTFLYGKFPITPSAHRDREPLTCLGPIQAQQQPIMFINS